MRGAKTAATQRVARFFATKQCGKKTSPNRQVISEQFLSVTDTGFVFITAEFENGILTAQFVYTVSADTLTLKTHRGVGGTWRRSIGEPSPAPAQPAPQPAIFPLAFTVFKKTPCGPQTSRGCCRTKNSAKITRNFLPCKL